MVVAVIVEGPAWFEVSEFGFLCLSANSLSWNREGGRVRDKEGLCQSIVTAAQSNKGEASAGHNGTEPRSRGNNRHRLRTASIWPWVSFPSFTSILSWAMFW